MCVPPQAEHRDLLPSGLIAAKDLLSFECPVETGFPVLGQVIIMKGKAKLGRADSESYHYGAFRASSTWPSRRLN
jgi:hypothetical protein